MKIVTWNVNGIRSRIFNSKSSTNLKKINQKDLLEENSSMYNMIYKYDPDIICLQETRISVENSNMFKLNGYFQYFNESKLEGARDANRYSGTAIYTRYEPNKIEYSIPDYEDFEGRIIIIHINKYVIINVYTPNSGTNFEKRLHWQYAFEKYLKSIDTNKNVIFCGDMNVAYRQEDAHFNYISSSSYKKNTDNIVGYLKEERDFIQRLLQIDYEDAFIKINKETVLTITNKSSDFNGYTWWDPRAKKVNNIITGIPTGIFRYNNVGWRLDYFFIRGSLDIKTCKVLKHIGEEYSPQGSDHAPVFMEYDN